MKKNTYEFRNAQYNQLSLLDGNIRLRMADRNDSQSTLVHASAPAATLESPKAFTTKHAIAATMLMLGFTVLFWILLGYIQTH